MKIIEKIILFVKKLFIKENEIKKIETLICKGDGLGIQKKISY